MLLICPQLLLAQGISIKGSISDKNGDKLLGASIIALNIHDSTIVSYGISDVQGIYELLIHEYQFDTILVEASFLGKRTQQKLFASTALIEHNWILQSSFESVPEIIIKGRSVEVRGDTINYLATSFTDESDRVLSDILKKIPGISVSSSGKISFEGEPINRFYIEGLNLLNGKYNIASESLTPEQISTIQVIRNHQPKRVLENIEITNKAAINIKLKNKLSSAVNLILGGGLNNEDALKDLSAVPLLFNKNIQSISAAKLNNSGSTFKDIEKDHFRLLRSDKQLLDRPETILDIIEPDNPPFESNRWAFNNSIYLSNRQLFKVKNEYNTLQGSFSYTRDKTFAIGDKLRIINLTSTTDALTEEEYDNKIKDHSTKVQLKYESNRTNSFFSTNTSYTNSSLNKTGLLKANSNIITQQLNTPSKELRSSTDFILPISDNKILQLSTEISFVEDQEFLSIDSFATQSRSTELLQSSIDGSTIFRHRALKFKPFIKMDYQTNALSSANDLLLSNNNINFRYLNYLFGIKTEITLNNLVGSIELTINYYNLTGTNKLSNATNKERSLIVLPKVGITYDLSKYVTISANYGDFKRIYSIDKYAQEGIMINYRTKETYNETLITYNETNIDVSFKYSNPINLIYASLRLSHNRKKSPFVLQSEITPIGFIDNLIVDTNNFQNNNLYSFNLSKKIIRWKTYVNFNINYRSSESPIIVNSDNQERLKNSGISSILNLDIDFSNRVNLLVGAKSLVLKTLSDIRNVSSVYNFELLPTIGFALSKEVNLKFQAQIIDQTFASNNNKFHFFDAKISYSSPKKGWTIDATLQNITGYLR